MLTDADVERWLTEDVGHHDVTNQVPGETAGRLVAKASGVAAGGGSPVERVSVPPDET